MSAQAEAPWLTELAATLHYPGGRYRCELPADFQDSELATVRGPLGWQRRQRAMERGLIYPSHRL
jgi:hypothetical protein